MNRKCPKCSKYIDLDTMSRLLVSYQIKCPHCEAVLCLKARHNFLLSCVLAVFSVLLVEKLNIFPDLDRGTPAVAVWFFSYFVVIPAIGIFLGLTEDDYDEEEPL